MIVPSLVRFGYRLISVLGVRMCQNVLKRSKSVSVIASRVTSSLLRALVRKRNISNDMVHGRVSFGLHPPMLVR